MSHRGVWGLGIAACLLSLLSLGSWAERLTRTGLDLRVTGESERLVATYPRSQLGTGRIEALLAREAQALRAEWAGYWDVPEPGFAELVLKCDGEAQVEFDSEAILGTGPDQPLTNRLRRPITAGPHRLRVSYIPHSGASGRREIFLKGITTEGRSVPVGRRDTSPREPTRRDRVMASAGRVLPALALFAWAALLTRTLRREKRAALMPKMVAVALCLVTLLAAALRFEALVIRYWGASAPEWAVAMASDIRALRPGGFEHAPTSRPYEGDPFSYLTLARSMGAFYEPSAREPLFPALTRLALSLAGDRDIGINVLSAIGSTLTCVAIFALGVRLLSPWSGLLASLLWAVEWQVISFSVEGWRDDVFSLQVAGCAGALVALHLKPTRRGGILLGIGGGLTLLTRLSALTFLIPGLLSAVLLPSPAPRRDRLGAALTAMLGMVLLAGPFMMACAFGFGDPFYAVNVHAAFYRNRAGLPGLGGSTALQFLAQHLPWEFVETGVVGLTSYPFENKWFGLGAWRPGFGDTARLLALAGLPVLLWRPGGVVALVVLFSSIAPYAWTWGIPGGSEWRFTLPAYPFYLVSAAIAVEAGFRQIVQTARSGPRTMARAPAVRYGATAVFLLVLTPWVLGQLDWLRVRELIGQRRPALIQPGSQARFFFESGWTWARPAGEAATATITQPEARLRLPIPAGVGARVTLRLGSTQEISQQVEILLGDRRLGSTSSPRDDGGTTTVEIAADSPRPGDVVELRFLRERSSNELALALLWVRIEPF